jgi:hypothetical protein
MLVILDLLSMKNHSSISPSGPNMLPKEKSDGGEAGLLRWISQRLKKDFHYSETNNGSTVARTGHHRVRRFCWAVEFPVVPVER